MGDGAAATCGCVGKFRNRCGRCRLLFVLCLAMVQRDFVGVWVNSAQLLRLLPAFVCVVFGGAARLVGAWVNSAQSLQPLPAFVCVVVFGAMVQRSSTTCGCVGKFRTIVAAVAGFCLCCVWGGGAAQLCGCVGKFRTIVAAVANLLL